LMLKKGMAEADRKRPKVGFLLLRKPLRPYYFTPN